MSAQRINLAYNGRVNVNEHVEISSLDTLMKCGNRQRPVINLLSKYV